VRVVGVRACVCVCVWGGGGGGGGRACSPVAASVRGVCGEWYGGVCIAVCGQCLPGVLCVCAELCARVCRVCRVRACVYMDSHVVSVAEEGRWLVVRTARGWTVRRITRGTPPPSRSLYYESHLPPRPLRTRLPIRATTTLTRTLTPRTPPASSSPPPPTTRRLQVLFANVIALGWNSYLSLASHR